MKFVDGKPDYFDLKGNGADLRGISGLSRRTFNLVANRGMGKEVTDYQKNFQGTRYPALHCHTAITYPIAKTDAASCSRNFDSVFYHCQLGVTTFIEEIEEVIVPTRQLFSMNKQLVSKQRDKAATMASSCNASHGMILGKSRYFPMPRVVASPSN